MTPRARIAALVGLAFLLTGCRARLFLERTTPVLDLEAARRTELRHHPWPDYVTGEERNRIEEALTTIWDVGGRDGRDAEKYIVGLDKDAEASRFRAVGRLVSEMKTVVDSIGVTEYEGKSRIMVLDRILRKIDGVQERVFREVYGIDLDDPPARCLRIAAVWNWWYAEGRFLERHAPWDFRVDMMDDPDPDGAPAPREPEGFPE